MKIENKSAFTLSEVVITLIVIGIAVSATIPMLNNNVADKKWNVARQKAKATIGEAFRLMTVNGEITTNKTTAQFVEDVIPKYLKLEKTCSPADYQKCGFPSTVKTPKGDTVVVSPKDYKWSELSNSNVWKQSPTTADNWNFPSYYDTFKNKYGAYDTSYYFRTLDGFSVAFLYNPYCAVDTQEHYLYYNTISGNTYYGQLSLDTVCMMGIYDMNGKTGPNKAGKDIGFVGSFYNGFETKSAAVLPHSEEKHCRASGLTGSTPWEKLNNYCKNLGKDNDWIMPDVDETSLIYLNYRLIGNGRDKYITRWFFTRSPLGVPGYFYRGDFGSQSGGVRAWSISSYSDSTNVGPYVRCVRNTSLK